MQTWRGVTQFTRSTQEVERHVPLLRKMLGMYEYGSALSYDEKFAAGLIGIALALERFDPAADVKLSYWISYNIDRQIRMENRRALAQVKYYSQSRSAEDRFDAPDERETLAEVEEREEKNARKTRLMYEALETLPTRERRLVEALYFEGKTQREVAKEMGVAQSWASRLCRSALKKARREMERRAKAEGLTLDD